MRILRGPLDTIVAGDIDQLCADQISEGTEIEFKVDLPHKGGLGNDSWHSGGNVGDYARNEIASEIVAFANTFGGVVCIGIAETVDHPKRADKPNPLPRVHELARRLRQAVYDTIDPPLPILEAWGVELRPDGSGVVLLRVAPSRRRPHRSQSNREVYVRRADESVRISMREIQELTIQAVSETTRIDSLIQQGRNRFLTDFDSARLGVGYQLLAIPATQIDLGRVAGRPELTDIAVTTNVVSGNDKIKCTWPPREVPWKPGLRVITNDQDAGHIRFGHLLRTTGECEIKFAHETPLIQAGLLVGGLGTMLAWIERVRQEAKANVEYALAAQLVVAMKSARLLRYGVTHYYDAIPGPEVPIGVYEFPIMSVGSSDEFPRLLQCFDEDIWDLTGQGVHGVSLTFEVARPVKP
jgi:hypothetical protein